jgi:hypothetical protein
MLLSFESVDRLGFDDTENASLDFHGSESP